MRVGAGITCVTTPPGGTSDLDPVWSPDGTLIAFSRSTGSDQSESDIFVVQPDGTRLAQVTMGGSVPAWWPDSRHLLFSRREGFQTFLHVIAVDGSGERRLFQGLWGVPSSDGSRIAYVAQRGSNAVGLWVATADGSGGRVVADDPYGPPSWSPAQKRVVFQRFAPGTRGRALTVAGRVVTRPASRPSAPTIALPTGRARRDRHPHPRFAPLASLAVDARRIHHLGVAVDDLDEAIETYRLLFGAALECRDRLEEQGVEAAAVCVGSSRVELLAATGDETPVGRFLAKRGPGMHHIAYEVADIRAALRSLARDGAQLIDEEPQPGLFGLQVAFVHPDSVHGVLAEVVSDGG